MSKIISSKSNSSASTQEEETHIITLIPCDYDSFDEDDDDKNSSQNSIDSSELADDSDGEIEIITYFRKVKKNLDVIDE